MYICLNKPGVTKESEVAQYKKGFPDSEFFHKNGETKIIAFYKDKDRNIIKFNSSPFEEAFEIKLSFKRIPKKLIKDIGVAVAYIHEETTTLIIQLT
jgi:hypothetical protein